MIDYRAPVDALYFALRFGADARRLPNWDDDLARQVIEEAARFVDAEVAPLDPMGDAEGARLVDGRVRLPDAFVAAYKKLAAGGWQGLTMSETHGGQGLPHVLGSVVTEMLAGACVTFQMIVGLAQAAARAIATVGTPEQQARCIPPLASGEWLATMCLTEPQAGSDLGQIRTLATPAPEGGYRIRGTKIFISGGDQNLSRNILHLVLARTPDAPPGVKGLSLFLCTSVLEDGTRNTLSAVRLEEKMGMHGSPTCQMAFEDTRAELLGREGEGLANMFVMMNAARIDVAVQGVGLAEVARQRARAYAAERRQGRGADGKPALINQHADVRRMLLTQRALAEGCRALVYRTDVELELKQRPALVELLTVVCKAFCTDAAMEAAQHAVQVHGGYGYLREYRVEQIVRDARITQIYEGTNGIQAHTLADRVIRAKGGAAVQAFRDELQDAMKRASDPARTRLTESMRYWESAVEALMQRPQAGAAAPAFLRLTGLVAVGAAWARLEAAADHAPDREGTRALAAFYRDNLLPECAYLAERVGAGMDLTALPASLFNPY